MFQDNENKVVLTDAILHPFGAVAGPRNFEERCLKPYHKKYL